MLTAIEIGASNPLRIPIIGSTIADKYIIKEITGLGPPDISLALGDLAEDGSIYQNRRVPSRNPVISIGFNPDYSSNETIDDLRDDLYRYFLEPGIRSPEVTVMLEDSAKPNRYFRGYVETFETPHFTKDPEAQISIICPDPYLSGTLQHAEPYAGDEFRVTNIGTAPSGFRIEVEFLDNVSNFKLHRDGRCDLDLTYEFLTGDILEIDTRLKTRKVRRKRSDNWLNIIDTMDDMCSWPSLYPGENIYTTETDQLDWLDIEFTPQWWGV